MANSICSLFTDHGGNEIKHSRTAPVGLATLPFLQHWLTQTTMQYNAQGSNTLFPFVDIVASLGVRVRIRITVKVTIVLRSKQLFSLISIFLTRIIERGMNKLLHTMAIIVTLEAEEPTTASKDQEHKSR